MAQTEITGKSLLQVNTNNIINESIGNEKFANNSIGVQNFQNNGVIESAPIGSVMWVSTSSIPIGYMYADGSQLEKLAYPELYEVIGDRYAKSTDSLNADNSLYFRIPDLRSIFVRGWNNTKFNYVTHSTYNPLTWQNVYPSTANIQTNILAPDGSNTAVRFTCLNNGSALFRVYFDTIPQRLPYRKAYNISFWCRWVSGTGNPTADWSDQMGSTSYGNQLTIGQWRRINLLGYTLNQPSYSVPFFIDLYTDQNTNLSLEFWGLQVEPANDVNPTSFTHTTGTPVTGVSPDHNRILGSIEPRQWKSLWFTNTRENVGNGWNTGDPNGYQHQENYMGKNIFPDKGQSQGEDGGSKTGGYIGRLFTGYWNNSWFNGTSWVFLGANRLDFQWEDTDFRPKNISLVPCIKYASNYFLNQISTTYSIVSSSLQPISLKGDSISGNLSGNEAFHNLNYAGLEAPKRFLNAHRSEFARGWNFGGPNLTLMPSTNGFDGIRINQTGIYEVWAYQRDKGTGGNPYISVAVNNNRTVLETREDGIYSHSHGGNRAANYSYSTYIGFLSAGEVLTCGQANATDAQYSTYSFQDLPITTGQMYGYSGALIVKHLQSINQYQTAVVNNGRIYTSHDYGINWTPRDSSRFWSDIAISSDGRYQTAVVNGGFIYVSSNFGLTWTALYSSQSWSGIAMSPSGIDQVAVVNGGQIHRSFNYGVTWAAYETNRNWRSVAISSDGRYITAVAGSSTQSDRIYTSSYFGLTWTPRESARYWRSVAISSDGRYQTAVAGSSVQYDRIYTSSDYGVTWTPRESARYWRSVAISSDGRYQTAIVDNFQDGRIYTSSDYGVTWIPRESPRFWYKIAMSANGMYQTAINTINAGNNQIYTSSDYGVTWTPRESGRDWEAVAISR